MISPFKGEGSCEKVIFSQFTTGRLGLCRFSQLSEVTGGIFGPSNTNKPSKAYSQEICEEEPENSPLRFSREERGDVEEHGGQLPSEQPSFALFLIVVTFPSPVLRSQPHFC